MKLIHTFILVCILTVFTLACACSNDKSNDTVHKPDYSFLNEAYSNNNDSVNSDDLNANLETTAVQDANTNDNNIATNTGNKSNNSDAARSDDVSSENAALPSDNASGNANDSASDETYTSNEWPYELNFSGIDISGEVKAGNLLTNYRFFSALSCLVCPDKENDILYYVNYPRDNYIYQLKDGNINLLVDIPANNLQLWGNKLYFISPKYYDEAKDRKSGDIYCYDITDKRVELLLEAEAFSLVVDSYGIFYQANNGNAIEAYRLDFASTSPQKTEYIFYFPYNDYMIINDMTDLYLYNRETGEKTFLVPLIYANNNNLRFAGDYMIFNLEPTLENKDDSRVFVLNLRTGKKDIYDILSIAGPTFRDAVDYFISDNVLYAANTNRLLGLDLSNGQLKFRSKYITYREAISSVCLFAGKDHYYTVYSPERYNLSNLQINERALSNGAITKELSQ